MNKLRVFFLAALSLFSAVFFVSCAGGGGAEANTDNENAAHFYVTFSICMENLVRNLDQLDRDRRELVPVDGIFFPPTEVAAFEGESVFDVLQRVTREARIHMVARFTPVINEAYVEAIGNIFAFDAGALSGWQFVVNGEFPGVSSSSVDVRPGDVILWAYTLDLGRDLGAGAW